MKKLIIGTAALLAMGVLAEVEAAGPFSMNIYEQESREINKEITEGTLQVEWSNRPTTGYDVEIVGDFHLKGGILDVNYMLHSPDSEIVLPVVTHPTDARELPVEEEKIEKIRGGELSYELEEQSIILKWHDRPTSGFYIDIETIDFINGNLMVEYMLEYPDPEEDRFPFVETVIETAELPVPPDQVEEVKLIERSGVEETEEADDVDEEKDKNIEENE